MTFRKKLNIFLWIVFFAFILFVISITLFHFIGKGLISEVETHRMVSPNGKIDAVIIEADGGATTSVIQRLYILKRGDQPSGKPVAFIDGAVINNKETNSTKYGVMIKWKSPNELLVQYSDARNSGMDHSTIEIDNEKIHIELDKAK